MPQNHKTLHSWKNPLHREKQLPCQTLEMGNQASLMFSARCEPWKIAESVGIGLNWPPSARVVVFSHRHLQIWVSEASGDAAST